MKKMLLVMVFLALLSAGCVQQKESGGKGAASAPGGAEKLTVSIISPKSGEILQGNKDVGFNADVKGGKEPYTYKWSSNIDGVLSTSSSFEQNPSKLSKGQHFIILEVGDASGSTAQGSVVIQVM